MTRRRRTSRRQVSLPKTLGGWLILILAALVVYVFQQLEQSEPRPPDTRPGTTAERPERPAPSERPEPPERAELPEPPGWPAPAGMAGKVAYAGLPRDLGHVCEGRLKILENTGFTVGYCEDLKNPAWVSYRAGPERFPDAGERPQRFDVDTRTTALVEHKDYARSGYDRGHMAPNSLIATRHGREAQLQTFLMSNIVPQRPKLNQKVWREIEESAKTAFRASDGWVVVGPVFGKRIERLPSGVALPESCFMLIVGEARGRLSVRAYLVPQDVRGDESPSRFLSSVDEIERRTGLDFLMELPDDLESEIEAAVAGR
jgi:DNA/RNA endonuclease G (NUC1)